MNSKNLIWKAVLIMMCFATLAGCNASDSTLGVHISPKGNDVSGSGTKGKPFATLERALEEVRKERADSSDPQKSATIYVKEGIYPIKSGITLTEKDSNLHIKAEPGAVFSGGTRLEGAKTDIPGDIAARLNPEALPNIRAYDLGALGLAADEIGKIYSYGAFTTAGKYDGEVSGAAYADLFVGGKRQQLARYPNGNEFARTNRILEKGDNSSDTENYSELRNPKPGTFTVRGDLFARVESWKSLEDVWILGYFMYDWADMTTPIAKIDVEKKSITPIFTSIYGYKHDAPFCFFNVLEELDAPGEWYLDRESNILYSYPSDEDGEVILSTTSDDLLTIDGAENITIEGLGLQCGRGGGIRGQGDKLTVKDCTLSQFSTNAISLSGYNNLVTGCDIRAIGGDAISLSGGDRQTLTPSNSAAENNHMESWSEITRTYRAAVRLSGMGLRASHNEMHDAPHLAITYSGNDIIIEYNDIYDTCYNTFDGGAIYAGRSWSMYGCIIRYNHLRNIGGELSGDYGPMAIYLDDALSGHEIYGNILEDCHGLAMLIGGGRDIVIKNNIFINSYRAMLFDQRAWDGYFADGWFAHMVIPESTTLWDSLGNMPYTSQLWAEKYPELSEVITDRASDKSAAFPVNPAGNLIENNVICLSRANKFEIAEQVNIYSQVGENLVLERNADPGFVDLEGRDLNLKESSIIFSELEGFEKIPYDKIGRFK